MNINLFMLFAFVSHEEQRRRKIICGEKVGAY